MTVCLGVLITDPSLGGKQRMTSVSSSGRNRKFTDFGSSGPRWSDAMHGGGHRK